MKNTIIIFTLFAFFSNSSACQSRRIQNILDNNVLKFRIITTSPNIVDSNMILSQSFISVEIPNKQRRKLLEVKFDQWMNLLANNNTDWAANLFLYDFYKKDALLFRSFKTKEDWRKCCKEDDLIFWRRELPLILKSTID